MTVKLSKIVSALGEWYPYALAESWDNVGLIFGDPRAEIGRVLLALDLTLEVAQEAAATGCGAVITHHPPIFQAIKRIDLSTTQGEIIGHCLANNIASVALHTNLDSADGGLNDVVGKLLGLTKLKPLVDSGKARFFKLAVFVPATAADKVRQAMFDAGAGAVGKYDLCSFNTPGTGTFRGGEGTNPAIGTPGSLESVEETRIEVLLQRERFGKVYSAMLAAHPYEEVAYDLYPLENRERETGLGRIGILEEPITPREAADRIAGLGMMVLRTLGDPSRRIRKIALCTGAGSDFTSYAADAGADLYLTAEVKHHHALDAHRRGLCIVETDHLTLERVVWPDVKRRIEAHFDGAKTPKLEARVSERERNPWASYP
jgi:dinuclear metal center YbgI/SA1388 family protein